MPAIARGRSVSTRDWAASWRARVGVEDERMGFVRQGLYDPANEHDSCGVGFVANIKGRKSHEVIDAGLKILMNLDHRGAVGADPLVGDGAGILIQLPDALLNDWARAHGKSLPAVGRYAVAMCFLPRDATAREHAIQHFEQVVVK